MKNKWHQDNWMAACLLPTMLHVLRLIHADGQFDPEIVVRAGFGEGHLVQLRLLRAVGSGVEDHLVGSRRHRT